MVDLSTDDKFRAWLEVQPQEVSVAIAARAAWRVLPLVAGIEPTTKNCRNIVLPLLRGYASALVAPQYPTSAEGQTAAAFAAARSASAAAPSFAPSFAASARSALAAASAASAASAAAPSSAASASARSALAASAAAPSSAASASARSALAAAALAAAAASARSALAAASAAAFAARSAARSAAESDASVLADDRLSPQALLAKPLWPDGTPKFADRWMDEFRSFSDRAGDGFDIWLEWYEAVLNGGPRDEYDAAFARAINDLALWKKSPAEINAQIRAWVEEERARADRTEDRAELPTIANLPSPVDFAISSDGVVTASTGQMAVPELMYPGNDDEHAEQIAIVKKLASHIIAALKAQKYQVRGDYADLLIEVCGALPGVPDGNLKWADTSFRTLTSLFNAEALNLPEPFAARLRTFGEEYQALRAFYGGLQTHYERIRKGKITRPLPTEVRRNFQKVIAAATPFPFDPSVQKALGQADKAAKQFPVDEQASAASGPSIIKPLPDPIANVDPEKDRDLTFASVANKFAQAVERGEKLHKGAEGWQGLTAKLRPTWESIFNWLKSGGDVPPTLPPSFPL